jgi:transcriptional regulator of aromatic amino acid metabolism
MHMRSLFSSIRALDHTRAVTLLRILPPARRYLSAPALVRGFGTKLLKENTTRHTRMASSAAAVAADVSARPAVQENEGQARVIDGTALAKYAHIF